MARHIYRYRRGGIRRPPGVMAEAEDHETVEMPVLLGGDTTVVDESEEEEVDRANEWAREQRRKKFGVSA